MKSVFVFVLGLLTVPLLLAVVGWLGGLPVAATDAPPRWEVWLAGRALDASLARRAKGLEPPFAADEATLRAGMKLFRDNCAGCHGDGKSSSPWGDNNFYPRVPQFLVEPPDLSAPETFVVVKHGIRYSGMGGWNGMLSDDDIWRVSLFVSGLKSLPAGVDKEWRGGRNVGGRASDGD
jgi:mono/diheme cytochrome c family protein